MTTQSETPRVDANITWKFDDSAKPNEFVDAELARQLEREVTALTAQLAEARRGLDAVADLINESSGVTGLHLNGDVASWDELRTGGRFEDWLIDFDAALQESKK